MEVGFGQTCCLSLCMECIQPEFTLSDPCFTRLSVYPHTAPFVRSHTTTHSVCAVTLDHVEAATMPFLSRPFSSVTRVDGTRAALPLTRVSMRQVEAITCTYPSRARWSLRVTVVNPTGGFHNAVTSSVRSHSRGYILNNATNTYVTSSFHLALCFMHLQWEGFFCVQWQFSVLNCIKMLHLVPWPL